MDEKGTLKCKRNAAMLVCVCKVNGYGVGWKREKRKLEGKK
jgi:hypothetical protein